MDLKRYRFFDIGTDHYYYDDYEPTLLDSSEEDSILSSSARMVDLPAILNTYTLQRGLPSPRGGFTAPSPRRPMRQ